MRHKEFDATLESALGTIRDQTEAQAREYFCEKFNQAVLVNDANALVFWSGVYVIWKNAPLTDQTRYLTLSMAVQAPYLPNWPDGYDI